MKKIIITGAPRTGTTALGTLLSHSGKILVMHELGLYDSNPQNYHKRKNEILKLHQNKKFLEKRGLTEKDIDDFFKGDFKNKGDLEFFGDKWPTYCTSTAYCSHLVKNHPDAYFIFTYRNPCAIIHSNIKRTKHEPNSKADWTFISLEENTNKIIEYTTNWISHIFPHVKNKIIIDYDHYINKEDLLINDLNEFLNTKIDIDNLEGTLGNTECYDKGFRGLYKHSNPKEYLDNLTHQEIDFISNKTKLLDENIKSLIEYKI